MELDKRQIYYVYEWYNKDNDYVFYVGKGRGHRCRDTAPADRNKPFIEYLKNNPNCTYRKIAENLDEDTACKMEDARIKELDAIGQAHCNIIKRTTHRGVMYGKDNGFYGKTHTDEVKKDISNKLIGKFAGDKNPQYGVSPRERMGDEKYKKWLINRSKSMIGDKNHRALKILAYNNFDKYEFDCIKDCASFIISSDKGLDYKIDSVISRISEALRTGCKYKGYYFLSLGNRKIIPTNKINALFNINLINEVKIFCKNKKMSFNSLINELVDRVEKIPVFEVDKLSCYKVLRFKNSTFKKLENLISSLSCSRSQFLNLLLKNFLKQERVYES